MSMAKLSTLDLLEWENFLNTYTGKRYHLSVNMKGFYLLEVKSMFDKKMLVNNLTAEQMKIWLMRHIKVSLE